MMLGTAASNSTAVETGPRNQLGASSEMKSAMPKLTGIAISIAIAELISVPTMNTSAPKRFVTGSQSVVVKKRQQNTCNACEPSLIKATRIASSVIDTRSAMKPVSLRNRKSAGKRTFFPADGFPLRITDGCPAMTDEAAFMSWILSVRAGCASRCPNQIPRFFVQYALIASTVLEGSGPKAIERAMSWPLSKPQAKNLVTSWLVAFGASLRRICQVQPEIGQLSSPGWSVRIT